jgi:O-antigen ligase
MKWLIFAIGVAGVLPLTTWLRQNRHARHYAIAVLIALPFLSGIFPRSQIALFGDPDWSGYADGFDISITDLLALAIYIALPRGRGSIPFKIPFALYIGAIALSAMHAHFVTASLWYLWQCVRIFFFFVVIARVCQEEGGSKAVLTGLVASVCFEAALVLWQRFIIHNPHTPGSFFHQNALGFALHLAILPIFGLALSSRNDWRLLLVTFLGIISDVFTASRASLGLVCIGLVIVLAISIFRRWTAQKARVLAAGLVCTLILVPVVIRTLEIRAQSFGIETDDGRTQMNNAAAMMAKAYPFGVGANNFVPVAQREGYYVIAGVAYPNYNISPHNAYWTTLAETGYVGLFALLFLLSVPLVTAASCAWSNRTDARSDVLIGLSVGLALVMAHSEYEWLLLSSAVQYILAISIGLIAGLAYQLGYWSFKSGKKHENFGGAISPKIKYIGR